MPSRLYVRELEAAKILLVHDLPSPAVKALGSADTSRVAEGLDGKIEALIADTLERARHAVASRVAEGLNGKIEALIAGILERARVTAAGSLAYSLGVVHRADTVQIEGASYRPRESKKDAVSRDVSRREDLPSDHARHLAPTLHPSALPCENSAPTAAEKPSTPKPNKSEFIRSQPADLSADGVVEKAKAEGITVSTGLVYGVRSQLKAKRKTKNGAPRKSPAAKKTAAAVSPKATKAEFVRKFPKASPKEVIAKAQAAGVQIDLDYVYKVRSSDKVGKPPTKAETRAAIPRKGASVPRPIATASSAEDLLKAIAAEVGLSRAIEILGGERARVRALIGG